MQKDLRMGMSQVNIDGCGIDLVFPSFFWVGMRPPEKSKASPTTYAERKALPVIWRGSTSGTFGNPFNGEVFAAHRIRLATLMARSKLVDAKIFQIVTFDNANGEEIMRNYLEKHGALGTYVQGNEAFEYQMVLDVDGNTWSSRLPKLFWSDTLVLRASSFANFMDGHYIKAYVHYLPVRLDFSDLEDKIRWAMANPDRVDEIRANVRRDFPQSEKALYDFMTCYGQQLLLEYSCLVFDKCDA